MANYRVSRILPAILTVAIIIVVIVGFVALARMLFTAGANSSGSTLSQQDTARTALLNTGDGHAVAISVRGPIVADEDFRSYTITISPSTRTIETYKGYLGTIITSQSLPNNTAAYDQFVHALDKANVTNSKQLSDDRNDVRGVCASGRVYQFEVKDGGNATQTLWTSTCSGSTGSLKANASQVTQLFINQIPGSSSLISPLKL